MFVNGNKTKFNLFFSRRFRRLRLKDDEPIYIKNYRSPHSHVEEIQKQVGKLINDKIVEPSVFESAHSC